MTIYEETQQEITQDLLNNLPDKYQKTVGFPIYDFMRAIAIKIKDVLNIVSVILGWSDIDNMTGDDLTRWCSQRRGVERKSATPSTVILTTTGTGFSIAKGTIIGESDTGLFFATVDDVESETGIADIETQCTTAGVIGNIPAGSITKIPVTIDGLSSVINNENAIGGYDEENDDSLRERYYEDLKLPIVSGNKNHYRKWAKECTGVKDAKVKPLWNGDNTVKVIILDEENLIASDDLVNTVQDYIDPKGTNNSTWGCGDGQAPIGAYCTVAKATQKNVTISATIQKKAGSNWNTVQANIENALNKYFKENAFDDNCLVSYARISASILNCEGVKDHANLLVNGSNDNIVLVDDETDTEVAILTTLTLTEQA